MATIQHGIGKTYVTITREEAEWLQSQTINYSGGLNINIWEKGNHNRLYIQLSGKKDKVFFDLSTETLEAGMTLALANAIVAFIEAQMPVDVEEEIEEAAPEAIDSAAIQYAVIGSDVIHAVVEEAVAETIRYNEYFAEKALTIGMTGDALERIWIDWRDSIVAPIAQQYNPDRPHFGWAHIQNSLGMWDMFFKFVDSDELDQLPQSLPYTGGEPQIVW